MLSFFSCCNESYEKTNSSLSLPIQYSFRSDSINVNNLKSYLDDKLGFIVFYSNENNLKIINEIKRDNEINEILNNSYRELYRNKKCIFAKSFIDYLEINQNINEFSLLIVIITLKRENRLNPKCLITYIKDEKINDKSIKEMIKFNRYKNFSITPEPININSNRIVKIQFKYPDGIQTLERNFLKEDLIDSLYKFIQYTNIGYDFYLIQRFPYKIYNIMTNTLEQENLYPSAVVQIIKK